MAIHSLLLKVLVITGKKGGVQNVSVQKKTGKELKREELHISVSFFAT